VAYAKELHKIVTWIGICDGNMQEGSFRCDANVSVRKPGQPLGTRREIKNLNSFKFMQQAIDYEIRWQIEQIEDGHAIQQATVLFNPDTARPAPCAPRKTRPTTATSPTPTCRRWSSRPSGWRAKRVDARAAPRHGRARCADYGLPEYDATTLTQSKAMALLEAAARPAARPSWPATGSWARSRRLNRKRSASRMPR
jgi:aspartyl-tRNA(Asn)/glutamyl-tRNA(Gln) amidotransferase subunit B